MYVLETVPRNFTTDFQLFEFARLCVAVGLCFDSLLSIYSRPSSPKQSGLHLDKSRKQQYSDSCVTYSLPPSSETQSLTCRRGTRFTLIPLNIFISFRSHVGTIKNNQRSTVDKNGLVYKDSEGFFLCYKILHMPNRKQAKPKSSAVDLIPFPRP